MSGQLLPTPLAATGAPHAAAPGWLARAIEETPGRALRERLGDSPVTGGRRVIDGVAMVEVTFVAHEPAGREVLVHVNSLTDAIRTALDPAVMIPVGSSGAQTLSVVASRRRLLLLPVLACRSGAARCRRHARGLVSGAS